MCAIRGVRFTSDAHPSALHTTADGAWGCQGALTPTGPTGLGSYSRYPQPLRLAFRFGKLELLRIRLTRQTLSVAWGLR
jgi:hypothetical protein